MTARWRPITGIDVDYTELRIPECLLDGTPYSGPECAESNRCCSPATESECAPGYTFPTTLYLTKVANQQLTAAYLDAFEPGHGEVCEQWHADGRTFPMFFRPLAPWMDSTINLSLSSLPGQGEWLCDSAGPEPATDAFGNNVALDRLQARLTLGAGFQANQLDCFGLYAVGWFCSQVASLDGRGALTGTPELDRDDSSLSPLYLRFRAINYGWVDHGGGVYTEGSGGIYITE